MGDGDGVWGGCGSGGVWLWFEEGGRGDLTGCRDSVVIAALLAGMGVAVVRGM